MPNQPGSEEQVSEQEHQPSTWRRFVGYDKDVTVELQVTEFITVVEVLESS